MNKKLLWKTESLWRKYFKPNKAKNIDISSLYKNGVSVYNSDFHIVENFSFKKSSKFVHHDDYGKYFGLKNSQVSKINGKLVYLFDNHNKILHPFLEYSTLTRGSLASSCLDCGFDVVHIDAHNDDAVFPAEKLHRLELKNIQNYIKETRISDFFDFLSQVAISAQTPVIPMKMGIQSLSKNTLDSHFHGNDSHSNLLGNIHRYTKSTDFKEFKKPKNPYILSLDIDIFGPEGDFTDLESKVKIIAESWQCAEIVCIAMSPGFIDQKYAAEIIKIFVEIKK